jgi:hypothetical protein
MLCSGFAMHKEEKKWGNIVEENRNTKYAQLGISSPEGICFPLPQ